MVHGNTTVYCCKKYVYYLFLPEIPWQYRWEMTQLKSVSQISEKTKVLKVLATIGLQIPLSKHIMRFILDKSPIVIVIKFIN